MLTDARLAGLVDCDPQVDRREAGKIKTIAGLPCVSLHDASIIHDMDTSKPQPEAGGTQHIPVRNLKAGMTFIHRGRQVLVRDIEDTSAPLWMRAGNDPGHFTITTDGGYKLTIPRINTVKVPR